jgi:prepilin-type N-terminal cleavage/methylation domain-containing protein
MKMIHRGEKGFTLIELLVVIAILGVIAAVVALNVGNFFGRGTVQSANTELHQVQTAVIACMAECESGTLASSGWWVGGNGTVTANCTRANGSNDASFFVYGPLRAAYFINSTGRIIAAVLGTGDPTYSAPPFSGNLTNPWTGITWDDANKNWH